MAAPERFANTSDSFPLHRGRRPYMALSWRNLPCALKTAIGYGKRTLGDPRQSAAPQGPQQGPSCGSGRPSSLSYCIADNGADGTKPREDSLADCRNSRDRCKSNAGPAGCFAPFKKALNALSGSGSCGGSFIASSNEYVCRCPCCGGSFIASSSASAGLLGDVLEGASRMRFESGDRFDVLPRATSRHRRYCCLHG